MKFKVFAIVMSMLFISKLSLHAQELTLGTTVAEFSTLAEVPLTLNSSADIQGLVAVVEWDDANLTGESITESAALDEADTVVTRVESSYMVLGVVMDSNPSDSPNSEIIPPGNNILIATLRMRCGPGPAETFTPLNFVDGAHSTVDNSPLLDNIVVVGGLSIAVEDRLSLNPGSVRCIETPPKFFIDKPGGNSPRNGTSGCGDARVMMQNLADVEGYVVALCHDPSALTLNSIRVGNAASNQGAEFQAEEIFADGGTLGVVLDFNSPFVGQMIPPGNANNIAIYEYCCVEVPLATEPNIVSSLTFCDNHLGDPMKENVMVVGGLSITKDEGLALENGEFECVATELPPPVDGPQEFTCGDRIIEVAGEETLSTNIGRSDRLCLHLRTPEAHVQGFSMAISHCCDIEFVGDLDISGTILESIGAEFVSVDADSDSNDGDGCELIVGVLIDALPPFDGIAIAPMEPYQLMGCIDFVASENMDLCGNCCPIQFKDGLNGTHSVPVNNLMSIENDAKSVTGFNCEVCFRPASRFFRGDCNFSAMGGMSVDIADASAVVSFLFLTGSWKFNPPCLDACDFNDDGRIDLADAIGVLQFYLQQGAFPKSPGPGFELVMQGDEMTFRDTPPGPDPTDDILDCKGGDVCDN